MKNWNTIGQFSKKVGLSAKALRLYEKIQLIKSHARGENGYRYYHDNQIELALRLNDFKKLGFTLSEIKSLLQVDKKLSSDQIVESMQNRLLLISNQVEKLNSQKNQIKKILISLNKKSEPLKAQQRRAIMSLYGQVFIAVTGYEGHQKTAKYIQAHFKNAGQDIPIYIWEDGFTAPEIKPFILIIQEIDLESKHIQKLQPDVIVINNLGEHSDQNQKNYLNLFSHIGPHVNTIINADDRSAVELAGQPLIKKGRIFYFSKNKALLPQIKKIGGVISDGEELEIFGFNLKPAPIQIGLNKILTFNDEVALLSSLAAVMTVGFTQEDLKI
ncbi:transcriptional regulator [Bdellovibrio sp. qaytius]|nr:transcriptional regulator [Bdellovibrio sp. qaytius]